MSTIKANKHQIGSDVTPANNIVLTASNGDLLVNRGVHDGTLTEIARFSTDGLSGSDVVYTPAGTGAVTTTVQSKLRETVSVKDFIPAGTNTAAVNCATYIQAALDYANLLGNAAVVFPPATAYKCNSELTFYPNTVAIQGNGSVIDFSGMTTGYAISFSQSNGDANQRNALNKTHPIDSLYFNGPGGSVTVTAIKAIDQNYIAGDPWLSGITFRNCAFTNFYRDVEFGAGAFLYTFFACNFSITGGTGYDCSILVQPASNSGENHEFIACYWGVKQVIRVLNGNASVYFKGCSADYIPLAFDVQAGMVDWDGYIENNFDTNYWGKVSGTNSLLRIAGMVAITGNKSAYECFYCDSTATNGGLVLDVYIQFAGGVTYTPPSRNLVAGTGRVRCNFRAHSNATAHPAIGGGLNFLANGGFESAALTDWTLGGTTPPARSTTVAHSGTYSLAFSASAGNSPSASRSIPCQPGQQAVGGYWYQAPAISGTGGTFYGTITYTDAGGTQLFQSAAMIVTTNVPGWTYVPVYTTEPAPAGTANAVLTISIFGVSSGTPIGYIDDVTLAVV